MNRVKVLDNHDIIMVSYIQALADYFPEFKHVKLACFYSCFIFDYQHRIKTYREYLDMIVVPEQRADMTEVHAMYFDDQMKEDLLKELVAEGINRETADDIQRKESIIWWFKHKDYMHGINSLVDLAIIWLTDSECAKT